jgi:hypothetical protein
MADARAVDSLFLFGLHSLFTSQCVALPSTVLPMFTDMHVCCPFCECAAEEKKVAAGPEKLTHSLDILDAFATLSLEVPLTTNKCGPLLEQVVAQKEAYLQR